MVQRKVKRLYDEAWARHDRRAKDKYRRERGLL
jgi:hypothetical protein